MYESMYKYMRVGIIHFMAYPSTMNGEGPICETMKKIIIDDYFNAIEISWIKDANEKKLVKEMLSASHMSVAYGAQPRLLTTGYNINSVNEEERLLAVNTLKEGIDEAYDMGAEGFAFLSGKYDKNRKDEAFKALIKSTKQLCEYAGKFGNMKIIHEIFDYEVDKKSLIGPASLARSYAEEIKKEYKNFGLMVDLSHLPLLKETAEQAILPIKEHLIHAHIGNCVVRDPNMPGYGDLHPRFGFPGGENDVPQLIDFLRVLKDIGFLNCQKPPIVSFEVRPFLDEDPDIVIANAKRTLNQAWAEL